MSYRIESATKEEWAARCFAAETRLAQYEPAKVVEGPKVLWVDLSSEDKLNMYVGHASAVMNYLNMDVAYIRKDISDARITKLEVAIRWAIEDSIKSNDLPLLYRMRAALKELNN